MKNLVNSLEIAAGELWTIGPFLVESSRIGVVLSVEALDADSVDAEILGYDPYADATFVILAHSEDLEGPQYLQAGLRLEAGATSANLVLPKMVKITLNAVGGNEAATVSVDASGLRPNDAEPAVDADSPPVEAEVTLSLLHFEAADASTTFTDEIPGNTVTPAGTAQHDTAQFQFGAASLLCPTSSSLIEVAGAWDPADVVTGLTLEAWIRIDNAESGGQLVLRDSEFLNYLWLQFSSTDCTFSVTDDAGVEFISENQSITVNTNTWYHIAFVKDASDFSVFFNGDRVIFVNDATAIADNLTVVELKKNAMNGDTWFDECRLSSVPRYFDATYDVPVAAFEVD